MYFVVADDYRVKTKEKEKRDKYLDLAREQKKLFNMRVAMILVVIGALGTVPKCLEWGVEVLEIGGRIDTIVQIGQNTLQETWRDLLSSIL